MIFGNDILKEFGDRINDKIIIDIFVEESLDEAHKKPKSKRRELINNPCNRDITVSYPDKPDIEVHVRNRVESSEGAMQHGPSVKVKPSTDKTKIPYVVNKNGKVTLAKQYSNTTHAKDIEKKYSEIFDAISLSATDIVNAWDLEGKQFEDVADKIQDNIKDKVSKKKGTIKT